MVSTAVFRHVPFLSIAHIEAAAQGLFEAYFARIGQMPRIPVPVEEIVECHCGLSMSFAELNDSEQVVHLGQTDFDAREVQVDTSLDPDLYPAQLGRFRFTIAHELGHWVLHRQLLIPQDQIAIIERPAARVASSSPTGFDPAEFQANRFAAALLMPRSFVRAAWAEQHGESEQVAVDVLAERFQTSYSAMDVRVKQLGLIDPAGGGEVLPTIAL
ncbi:MAG: ImmA/IrrE family metallo-endopeptidase [Armatimonadota bacterium]